MTTINHAAPAPCDAAMTLQRAAFMLEQMTGTHVFDLGALMGLLRRGECEDHKPAGVDRPVIVKTSGAPLSLDPRDSYYRPPFTGRSE